MSTELTKASDLTMPGSSGVLNIPLIEYDELRSKCKKAIDVARELESKQKYIRVVVQEKVSHAVPVWDAYGRQRMAIDDKIIEKIEYKNLDDFRSIITDEEETKVAKKVAELNRQITTLKNANASLKDTIQKRDTNISEQEKTISEYAATLVEAKAETNKLMVKVEEKEEEISKSNKLIDLLKTRIQKYQSVSGLQLFFRRILNKTK